MAAGNLWVNLGLRTAAFDRGLSKSRRNINTFGSSVKRMGGQLLAIAGVGGGIYAVTRGLQGIVAAAQKQEQAEADLKAALEQTNSARADTIQFLESHAANLQKLTIYGDEQIISQMAYAHNLGVTADKLDEAATAAVGLAAKFKIDLNTAMMLIGRASQGQTQMLTRYGIVLDAALSPQDKFNQLLQIGATNFNLAEAAAQTSGGQIEQFKNTMGDLKEELGKGVIPALTTFIEKLNWIINTGLPGLATKYDRMQRGSKGLLPEMEWGRDTGDITGFEPLIPRAPGESGFTYPMGTPIGELNISERAAQRLANMQRAMDDTVTQEQKYQEHIERVRGKTAARYTQRAIENLERLQAANNAAAEATARKWEQVGHTMEWSMTSSIDRMIWEAERWEDALISILRDVAREMMRVFAVQPFVQGFMGMFGGGQTGAPAAAPVFPVKGERQSGGYIPETGLYQLHAGEYVQPANRGAPSIVINNNSGIPLETQGPVRIEADRYIIDVVSRNIQNRGTLWHQTR